MHNPARPAEIVGEAPAADIAQLDAAATAGEQLKERDGARLFTGEHGKVLSEASFEIDAAPMVAAVLEL